MVSVKIAFISGVYYGCIINVNFLGSEALSLIGGGI